MTSPLQPPTIARRPPSSLPQTHTSSASPAAAALAQQFPQTHMSSSFQMRPLTSSAPHALQPPPLNDMPYQTHGITTANASSGSAYAYPLSSASQGMQDLPPPVSTAGAGNAYRGSLMGSSSVSLPALSQRPPSSYADSLSNTSRPGMSKSTPPPSMTSKQSQPAMSDGNAATEYRPLNVRDALTYLDQVKIQFSSEPDVYNRFLDIMKDFKSQIIDTPGVIERVSVLFHGHPDLISGFNTFLPPGYHIECSTDPREPDVIKVTTPSGTTITRSTRPGTGSRAGRGPLRDAENTTMAYDPHPQPPLPGPYFHSPYNRVASLPPPNQASLPPPPPQPAQQPASHSTHPAYQAGHGMDNTRRQPPPPAIATHEQRDLPPPQTNGTTGVKRAPLEFNQAISYVNRIKTRFADDPETYKKFLEILQTYQKERRPILEVYALVQQLFNGAQDLLYEFKQFLPEIAGQPSDMFDGLDDALMGTKRTIYGTSPQYTAFQRPGKKKRLQGKAPKDSKTDDETTASGPFDPDRLTVSMEEIELFEEIRKHIGNKPSYEEFLKTLNLYTRQIIDADELMKQIHGFLGGDKELLEWVNKVIGLELKEKTIERPATAIPKPDLTRCKAVESSPSYRIVPKEWQNQPCSGRDQLCWEVLNDEYVSHPIWASEDSDFVASKKNQYEEAMHRCEEERYDYDLNIDANLNSISLLEPIVDQLEKMSPEARANFRVKPGLGGQSVSIYERVIKKVYEDERGNEILELLYSNPGRVIPVLHKRLVQKDKEWRKAQQEWNKVWREMDAKNYYKALDYQGLTFKSNDRKAMAVKSLVNEIETYHEEFNSTAEGEEKKDVAYPLLFSFGDAKVFKDISRLVFSYIEKQAGFSSTDRGKIRTFMRIFIPLFFHVDDAVPEGLDVNSDNEDGNSREDDDDDDDDAQSMSTDDTDTDGISQRTQSRSPPPEYRRRNRRTRADDTDNNVDLLRDVLTKGNKLANGDDNDTATSANTETKSPSLSRDDSATPIPETENDNMDEDRELNPVEQGEQANGDLNENGHADQVVKKEEEEEEDVNMTPTLNGKDADSERLTEQDNSERSTPPPNNASKDNDEGSRLFAAAAAATAPGVRKRTVYTFFCNSAFYCFFRLYQMLYERLAKMKGLDAEIQRDKGRGRKVNSVAHELGLYTSRFDDIDLSEGYYNALLDLIDRFFDGELDQSMFEEKARYIFVTDAYVLFTIDKLIQSMIKQIQAVTADEKSVELVDLFRGDQTLESACPRTMTVYRLRAEEIVGSDENLYKIDFNTDTHKMVIQLLDKDDIMLEPSPQDQYENYVASYLNWTSMTEGIDAKSMKPSFLRRNWKPHDRHLNEIFVRSGLHYKIAQESYHMYYIVGSEDIFVRPHAAKNEEETESDKASARVSKWRSWLESPMTGWCKDIDSDASPASLAAEARKLYI